MFQKQIPLSPLCSVSASTFSLRCLRFYISWSPLRWAAINTPSFQHEPCISDLLQAYGYDGALHGGYDAYGLEIAFAEWVFGLGTDAGLVIM